MNSLKFSLQDAFIAISIVTVVSCASYQLHRYAIENTGTSWRDTAADAFSTRRVELIRRWGPPLAVIHSTCAISAWLTVRGRDDVGSGVLAFGFVIPLVTAPLLPAVPAWVLPGYPVLLVMVVFFLYGFTFRPWVALWLNLVSTAWFVVASLYEADWFRLFGD